MKVRLLADHVIHDELKLKGSVVEIPPDGATPLMEGLDDQAKAAIEYIKIKVWGRFPNTPYGLPTRGEPLDTPPIPRPLEENQPVEHAHIRSIRDYTS